MDERHTSRTRPQAKGARPRSPRSVKKLSSLYSFQAVIRRWTETAFLLRPARLQARSGPRSLTKMPPPLRARHAYRARECARLYREACEDNRVLRDAPGHDAQDLYDR